MIPETYLLEGEEFSLIRNRRNGTGVYKNAEGTVYLRLGDRVEIQREYSLHKKLQTLGFPVAEILSEGIQEDPAFFAEKSLGEYHFGQLFAEEWAKNGEVSEECFNEFLTIIKKIAKAQAGTIEDKSVDWEMVKKGIRFDELIAETSERAGLLNKAYEKMVSTLATAKPVLSLGDFNPHNLFPTGMIDFEDHYYAPIGYDLVTAITTIGWFPLNQDQYEYFGKYRFSPEQAKQYLDQVNEATVPGGTDVTDNEILGALIFLRGCWAAVRMGEFPKLQKWRFEKLDAFLGCYLQSDDIFDFWFKS